MNYEKEKSKTDTIAGIKDDIVISAMSGVFPGAPDIDSFWHNIVNAEVAEPTTEMSSVWGIDRASYKTSQVGLKDKIYTDHAFCLPEHFEPQIAADINDRQVRTGRAVVNNLLETANSRSSPPLDLKSTGLVLATSWCGPSFFEHDFADFLSQYSAEYATKEQETAYSCELQLKEIAKGLAGPLVAVDNACAASLYGLDIGVQLIKSGRAASIILLGLNVSLSPSLFIGFSRLAALSPTGTILPYSAEANGIMVGEGAGAVLLESMADARKNKREIFAVIRSQGLSADGSEKSVFVPGTQGQRLAYERAYREPDSARLDYLEGHGTGTPVGDGVEIRLMSEFFSGKTALGRKIPLGSVKSIIGHTLASSGIASLIKAALILKHKIIPPHIKVKAHEQLADSCFYLPQKPEKRPAINRPRRVGITALGFGGANSHLVLESLAESPVVTSARTGPPLSERNFTKIAVLAMSCRFGGMENTWQWRDRITATADSCETDEKDSAQKAGFVFPAKTRIDRAAAGCGTGILKKIDPFQLLVVDSINNLDIDRHSVDTGIVVCANLGGRLSLEIVRRTDLLLGNKTDLSSAEIKKIANTIGPEPSSESIASGMPTMCSGYPAFFFDIKGFHQTVSGNAGIFWTFLSLADRYLSCRCKCLVLAAGQMIKNGVEFKQYSRSISGADFSLGEAVAAFKLKKLSDATADKDRIIAVIKDIVHADEAADFSAACRVAGIAPGEIDYHEINQLAPGFVDHDPKNATQFYSGYLTAATGVESLSGAILRAEKSAAIEVWDADSYVMTIFIDIKERLVESLPMVNPFELTISKNGLPDKNSGWSVPRRVESPDYRYGIIEKSVKETENLIHDYFAAQRSALTQALHQTAGSFPINPENIKLSASADSKIIKDIGTEDENTLIGTLIVNEEDPYFFDHPLDHVPGILLLAGIQELLAIISGSEHGTGSRPGCFIKSIKMTFLKYCEKDFPAFIKIHRKKIQGHDVFYQGKIIQSQREVCLFSLGTGIIQGVINRKNSAKVILLKDKKLIHKHRRENVFISSLKEINNLTFTGELANPGETHYLGRESEEYLSMLYVLEVTRQYIMLLAHSVFNIPLGIPMILLSLDASLSRPVSKNTELKMIWTRDNPDRNPDLRKAVSLEPVLVENSEIIGRIHLRSYIYDQRKYDKVRGRHAA